MRALILAIAFIPALQAADPPAVADLVKQLGDSRFAVREKAHAELLKRGEAIAPELQKLKVEDQETAERVGKVLYALVGYKDDIRRLLAETEDGKDRAPSPVAEELRGLIAAHQPGAGDLLLSLLADRKHPLHLQTLRTFVATWNVATPDQLDAFIRQSVSLKTEHRPKFPAKVAAMISFEAQLRDGWMAWPNQAPLNFTFRTRTTQYLDGKPYDKPFEYAYPFATVGWFRLDELAEGKHTIHAIMDYEFTQNGEKRKGSIRSRDSSFEIVAADTPDDLVAPRSTDVANLIQAAFFVRGVPVEKDGNQVREIPSRDGFDQFPPQVSWQVAPNQRAGIRCVDWEVRAPLSVDLCFDVEIHDVKSGKVYPADPIRITGNAVGRGYCVPRDVREFAKDRDGLVPVKVVMKPSRALALTDVRMKKYYADAITTGELWMKVVPNIEPEIRKHR
ncbi:MAG TPA: hypothetical protein VHR66_17710 [Gemmataceae bacterium]|jgi:hypothetical protein|nr:hypothetical protein [Gemmataceae bacterium]